MKIIGNPDWTHPLVRAKNAVAGPARRALAASGRWLATPVEDRAAHKTDAIEPAGDMHLHHRLVYDRPRPESEEVENLLYSPQGMGIQRGKVVERFSVRAPSIKEILSAPSLQPAATLQAATVIESETPYTYGDWVGDFICALACADDVTGPIALPADLAAKPYVVRDIAALGHELYAVDAPVLIEKARVLRKRIPSYFWGPGEVSAYRKAFDLDPPAAKPGSIMYLGRFDTVSESVQRAYPSETVAKIVESLGGHVFDTRAAAPALFNDMARDMETVIADQGSALFGVMHWRTKNVIELTRANWWHAANLFIANGAGVENYAVIAVDDLDEAALRKRIEGQLKAFGVLD